MFTLLLTVILGVCIGAVAADLLFGPDQPAMPSSSSHSERWDPWRGWWRSVRLLLRRAVGGIGHGFAAGARTLARIGAGAVDALWVRPLDAGRQAWAELHAHRQARRLRHSAHARHAAHHDVAPPEEATPAELEDEDEYDEDELADEDDDEDAYDEEPAAAPAVTAPLPAAEPLPEPQQPELPEREPVLAEPREPEPLGPGWRHNGSPVGAPASATAPSVAPPKTAPPAWPGPGTPDDPTLEEVIPATSELPVVTDNPAAPRPRGPRTHPRGRAPVQPLPRAGRPESPRPLGPQAPPAAPERSRLRALAILSLLVCAFGVATASVLLIVIVTLTRAVGGV